MPYPDSEGFVVVVSYGGDDNEFPFLRSTYPDPMRLKLESLPVVGRLALQHQPRRGNDTLATLDALLYNDGSYVAELYEFHIRLIMNGGACGGLANVHRVEDMVVADLSSETATSGSPQHAIIKNIYAWYPNAGNMDCHLVKIPYDMRFASGDSMRVRLSIESAEVSSSLMSLDSIRVTANFNPRVGAGGSLSDVWKP